MAAAQGTDDGPGTCKNAHIRWESPDCAAADQQNWSDTVQMYRHAHVHEEIQALSTSMQGPWKPSQHSNLRSPSED